MAEVLLEQAETAAGLLLAALDPDRRAAFVLTQLIGCSCDEAAAVCGCPVGTIRSRVARARADLDAVLTEPAAPRVPFGRADLGPFPRTEPADPVPAC